MKPCRARFLGGPVRPRPIHAGACLRRLPRESADNVRSFRSSRGTRDPRVSTLRTPAPCTGVSWGPQRENPRRHEGALSSHSLGLKFPRQRTEKKASVFSAADSLPRIYKGARSPRNTGSFLWDTRHAEPPDPAFHASRETRHQPDRPRTSAATGISGTSAPVTYSI